jgi:hypothetical protein
VVGGAACAWGKRPTGATHAQIMRDALEKVNWQEVAEALREE